MSKILISYATAGIGHKKAAQAIKAAFDEMKPSDTHVLLEDSLDRTNEFFKWSYLALYLLAINKLSYIWGLMYYLTDNFFVNIFVSRLRRFNNWLNSKQLVKYLLESNFDVIITTHFFLLEVAARLKAKGLLKSHLVTVVTDYRLHKWWISPYNDTYIVAGEDTRKDLMRWGIDGAKIKVIGIPAEPVFSKSHDAEEVIARYKLAKDMFTVLIIGGGFGVGPIEKIVKDIDSVSKPIQVIVICGHNEDLVKKLEAAKPGLKNSVKVLGYVNTVYDFMEIADVLISKSGGITVTESLAKKLPMIVIAPIPGQETRNCDFLLKHNAAVRLKKVTDIKDIVDGFIKDPSRLKRMRDNIMKIRRPEACYDIAKLTADIAKKM